MKRYKGLCIFFILFLVFSLESLGLTKDAPSKDAQETPEPIILIRITPRDKYINSALVKNKNNILGEDKSSDRYLDIEIENDEYLSHLVDALNNNIKQIPNSDIKIQESSPRSDSINSTELIDEESNQESQEQDEDNEYTEETNNSGENTIGDMSEKDIDSVLDLGDYCGQEPDVNIGDQNTNDADDDSYESQDASADNAELGRFTPELMVELNRIDGMAVSPDKTKIAFQFYRYFVNGDVEGSNIRYVSVSDPKAVYNATEFRVDKFDNEPVWLDSKNIAFISKKDNDTVSNVFVANIETGYEYRLTNYNISIDGISFNSNKNRLLFIASVYQGLSLEETAALFEKKKKQPAHGRIYDNLYVRHWDSWLDETKPQLFVQKIKSKNETFTVSGEPYNVVSEYNGRWGLMPFDYTISPDGQLAVFASSIPSREIAWSTRTNIFIVNLSEQSNPTSLNPESAGGCSNPVFSPDGKQIAWLEMNKPNNGNDKNRVVLYNLHTKKRSYALPNWSLSPESVFFSEDSKSLFFIVEEDANTRLFKYRIDSKELERLSLDGTIEDAAQLTDDTILTMYSTVKAPHELALIDLNNFSSEPTIITNFNSDVLDTLWMSSPESFEFIGAKNETVQGYMFKPYQFNPGNTYPLAFVIHGGPYGTVSNGWSWRWNPNVFTNLGFVVVAINFHGSTGFGQQFADSVRHQWGGYPYEDLMKGLNYALEIYPFIDPERMAALGASYGGYMIAWMLGKDTPFKAFVCHDGEFSVQSSYYSTDEVGFDEHDIGTPWDERGRDLFNRWDPSQFVSRWKTPTLVIHGEYDFRLPVTEGLSIFAALQRRGVPSRFLYFPDENHWVTRPANSLQWHQVVFDWIIQYTSIGSVYNKEPESNGDMPSSIDTKNSDNEAISASVSTANSDKNINTDENYGETILIVDDTNLPSDKMPIIEDDQDESYLDETFEDQANDDGDDNDDGGCDDSDGVANTNFIERPILVYTE